MTAASKAVSWRRLKRRAVSIGAVKAFDKGLQFLLPVVLVRSLDAHAFGEYRLLLLAVETLMVLSLTMTSGGLFYFLPRSDARHRRLYIHQALLYMAVVGLVCAWAVSPWNPLLPKPLDPLGQYGFLVPAYVVLWLGAMMLDALPTVDERVAVQAYATLAISVLRVVMVAGAAWLTGDLRVVIAVLVALAAIKLAVLLFYIHRHHGLGRPWFERKAFAHQFRHVAPFGVSNALFGLRSQADHWVAASVFALSSFAAFSIAGTVNQVVHLFRHSVLQALMPQLSRLHASGDVRGMVEMNRRANILVTKLLYPLFAFLFVFAEEVVTVIYTAAYVEASAAIRVYIIAAALRVLEVGSLLLMLGLGRVAIQVNALSLAVSVLVSWFGAHHFGLAGAAAGSLVAVYIDRALLLRSIAARSGVSLGELQDWRSLGRLIALAAATGALAWGMGMAWAESGPLPRLIAGGAVFAALYGGMLLRERMK